MSGWEKRFLKSFLFYAENGYPFQVSIKKAKEDIKLKKVDWNELEKEARSFLLSYFSLKGRKRTEKVDYWLKNKDHLQPFLPEWMEEELRRYIDIKCLLNSLKKRNLWIRVNTLKISYEKAEKELEEHGVLIEQDKDFPYLYKVIETKVNVSSLPLVKNLEVIIQDKASVAVVEELGPEKGDFLVDLSSSPGNKLSLYAMLTENDFRAIAIDVEEDRIDKEKRFLIKAGVDLNKVSLIQQDSSNLGLSRFSKGWKAMLDAPCSSSGMIYNDPTIIFSLRDKTKVIFYSNLQKKIMQEVSQFKPDLMVYSVCSLFPEEGENITEEYSDFSVNLRRTFSSAYSPTLGSRSTRLFPHLDGTNGFYISKFQFRQ
ncbi:RsmB/NOP family class I SAM-dependent RNA methyltransferase [Sulfuracidifex metallicus]|uniref:RsmB/NOP family class I SAM-dependent RNA methyltransferase n=1 Tax=Sulfuracidifex metallicus DSM 6482 = JCM 9184 TaxID=523847 RepID=A0A6A9QID3_SULME|nr:RsmB/NOP family class I SAM-dependent RNA methyltransferase [Sulfuracidifex metallicus]MUN28746.1 RsmB/NOP family class I SAM-dependent RNA methyltransferase [Sulfuracidifex metallicus DSM 6482 = JCM 9184]WOE50735.1 RsmB/NOP family class I SAM-dependent RNA methyltransferase [Sulfuracidifex metallicus DSM 6482 = JCM 9184]